MLKRPEYKKVKFLRPDGEQTRLKIMRFVRAYWDANHFGPCFREIMEECGLSTTSAVSYEVTLLKQRGFLVSTPGKARSLRAADMSVEFGEPVDD